MPTRQLAPTLRCLRRLLDSIDSPGVTDAELLQRFVRARDEAAFELLARRHGPMVQGVCRRLLRDCHDADDAFQATLLTLARKAGSIGRQASVGAWLYKVAYRVALRARTQSVRRARRERTGAELLAVADPRQTEDPAWRELRPVLDDELSRLPERYRAPLVLCYLEGLTNTEAARQLCCPPGTIKTRLAHARRVLAERLTRRGVTLGAGLLTADALTSRSSAAVATALVERTVRAAALVAAGNLSAAGVVPAHVLGLTEGALRTMMLMKLKLVAVIVATGLGLAGAGMLSYHAWAAAPTDGERGTQQSPLPTNADEHVEQLKKQIAHKEAELHHAEEARRQLAILRKELRQAEGEAALPPRQGPVALIFDKEPITRDELADYLLSHLTSQQLEAYCNQRILESACRRKGITVTASEVEAALEKDRRSTNMSAEELGAMLLKQHHKTLEEWKDDVVRPRLLMEKYSKAQISISNEAVRHAYEARYGERAECEMIVWPVAARDQARETCKLIRKNRTTFEDVARKVTTSGQGSPVSQPRPIGRHSMGISALEDAALALEPGEVSDLVEIPEGLVLLKCVRRLPPETSVRFEDVRADLEQELRGRQRSQDMAAMMEKLKTQAHLKVLWKPAR